MLTLTLRHSGDLGVDFRALQCAWVRLRAWFAKRGFRGLDFARVLQVTPSDGGHVHYHVVAGLPPVCYRWLGDAWRAATGDADGQQVDVQRGRGRDPSSAAAYVASYATKGGELDAGLRARWIVATYGRRVISTSRGLLGPVPRAPCPECEAPALQWLRRTRHVAPRLDPTQEPRAPPESGERLAEWLLR